MFEVFSSTQAIPTHYTLSQFPNFCLRNIHFNVVLWIVALLLLVVVVVVVVVKFDVMAVYAANNNLSRHGISLAKPVSKMYF